MDGMGKQDNNIASFPVTALDGWGNSKAEITGSIAEPFFCFVLLCFLTLIIG